MSNTWLESHCVANVPYLQMKDINFSSAEKKIKVLEKAATPTSEAAVPSAALMPQVATSDSELQKLFDAYIHSETKRIIFSVLNKPFCNFPPQSSSLVPTENFTFRIPEV